MQAGAALSSGGHGAQLVDAHPYVGSVVERQIPEHNF
jgi:hypothetical protein